MSGTAEQSQIGSRWITPIELTVLGAIWGASFLFMRIAAADFGPLALVELRLSLGALVLLPFLWRSRSSFAPRLIGRLAGIGIINSAIPFVLFAWGAERAPAGIGAITNAMTVLFTALMAFVLYREPIGPRRMIGLLTGFLGVVVLAGDKTGGVGVWPAALAGTLASLFYGVGVNLIRHYLGGVPASAVASATLLSATVFMAPFALASWPEHPIPLRSWLSAVALGVICTGAAFVLYYRLINRIGGPRASTVTYLIPLFSVVWAWLVLGEQLTLRMALAAICILGGVALSQRNQILRPVLATSAQPNAANQSSHLTR
jgi:drug/metabolite transporter (DMT)-like permease